MKKYLLIAVVVLAVIMSACAPVNTESEKEQETSAPIIKIINDTPEKFESNIQGEFLLLDVRTQGEYDEGHIEGTELIPVDELASRLDEIEEYKDLPVLVYCRSGNRSITASNILIENGFEEVHNLLGGIGAWNNYKGE